MMNCLCANTRRAARLLTRFYEEQLRASGLTSPQFEILSALAELSRLGRPGIAQTDLAAMLGLDQTTLSRTLKLLIASGWVKRSRSTLDRRETLYGITSAGIRARHSALPHWERAQAQMREALWPDFEAALALLQGVTRAATELSAA